MLVVLIAFGTILPGIAVGSVRYYGCLLILVGTGFIAGVVWSYALSYQLLRSHPASDAGFARGVSRASQIASPGTALVLRSPRCRWHLVHRSDGGRVRAIPHALGHLYRCLCGRHMVKSKSCGLHRECGNAARGLIAGERPGTISEPGAPPDPARSSAPFDGIVSMGSGPVTSAIRAGT